MIAELLYAALWLCLGVALTLTVQHVVDIRGPRRSRLKLPPMRTVDVGRRRAQSPTHGQRQQLRIVREGDAS